jgi:hypothetical protein
MKNAGFSMIDMTWSLTCPYGYMDASTIATVAQVSKRCHDVYVEQAWKCAFEHRCNLWLNRSTAISPEIDTIKSIGFVGITCYPLSAWWTLTDLYWDWNKTVNSLPPVTTWRERWSLLGILCVFLLRDTKKLVDGGHMKMNSSGSITVSATDQTTVNHTEPVRWDSITNSKSVITSLVVKYLLDSIKVFIHTYPKTYQWTLRLLLQPLSQSVKQISLIPVGGRYILKNTNEIANDTRAFRRRPEFEKLYQECKKIWPENVNLACTDHGLNSPECGPLCDIIVPLGSIQTHYDSLNYLDDILSFMVYHPYHDNPHISQLFSSAYQAYVNHHNRELELKKYWQYNVEVHFPPLVLTQVSVAHGLLDNGIETLIHLTSRYKLDEVSWSEHKTHDRRQSLRALCTGIRYQLAKDAKQVKVMCERLSSLKSKTIDPFVDAICLAMEWETTTTTHSKNTLPNSLEMDRNLSSCGAQEPRIIIDHMIDKWWKCLNDDDDVKSLETAERLRLLFEDEFPPLDGKENKSLSETKKSHGIQHMVLPQLSNAIRHMREKCLQGMIRICDQDSDRLRKPLASLTLLSTSNNVDMKFNHKSSSSSQSLSSSNMHDNSLFWRYAMVYQLLLPRENRALPLTEWSSNDNVNTIQTDEKNKDISFFTSSTSLVTNPKRLHWPQTGTETKLYNILGKSILSYVSHLRPLSWSNSYPFWIWWQQAGIDMMLSCMHTHEMSKIASEHNEVKYPKYGERSWSISPCVAVYRSQVRKATQKLVDKLKSIPGWRVIPSCLPTETSITGFADFTRHYILVQDEKNREAKVRQRIIKKYLKSKKDMAEQNERIRQYLHPNETTSTHTSSASSHKEADNKLGDIELISHFMRVLILDVSDNAPVALIRRKPYSKCECEAYTHFVDWMEPLMEIKKDETFRPHDLPTYDQAVHSIKTLLSDVGLEELSDIQASAKLQGMSFPMSMDKIARFGREDDNPMVGIDLLFYERDPYYPMVSDDDDDDEDDEDTKKY